jgi:serine/threonine protein kinase
LIGKPPFETSSLKETYSRIKRCEYKIPPTTQISSSAVKLIRATLQSDPKCRPKVEELLNSEFFTSGMNACIYLFCEQNLILGSLMYVVAGVEWWNVCFIPKKVYISSVNSCKLQVKI